MGKSPGLKLQSAIVQDNVPVEVAPRLYVGSIHAAFNIDGLKQAHITHIVNLAGSYATFPEEFTYCSVSIRDKEYADLLSCLPALVLFVNAALHQSSPTHDDAKHESSVLIHCAGGRSRSPAIAMAYLMITQKLTFDQALLRIRTARPVVSLNAGFEAQLRCLEEANGDATLAHQLLLQQTLSHLAQQRQEGQLDLESAHHKRRSRHSRRHGHHGHHSPRTPTNGDGPTVPHHGACDERGMLHGRVPVGLTISIPTSYAKGTQFVPALRSSGTLFGCRGCGEHLFCSSAIVRHKTDTVTAPTTEKSSVKSPSGSQTVTANESKSTKRPLLAKLRLRPHSPGVKARDAAQSGRDTAASSNPTTPRLAVIKTVKKLVEAPVSPPPPPTSPLQHHQDATHVIPKDETYGQHPKGRDNSFWRTLTAFKSSSKRVIKDAVDSDGIDDEKKKKSALSPKANAIDLSTHDTEEDVTYGKFLRENAQEWEHSFRALERLWNNRTGSGDVTSFVADIKRLIANETDAMVKLHSHDQWLIEPQHWLLAKNLEPSTGTIVCPNDQCGAELGSWNWDGLMCECDCGNTVKPAFQVNRHAVKTLGNVVIPPPQIRDGVAPSGADESPEAVSYRQ